MSLKLILAILSLIIIIIVPILFYLFNKKRGIKGNFFDFLFGLVFCFLCKDVLLKLVLNILVYVPFLKVLLTNAIASIIITTVLLSLLLLFGVLLIKKVYFKNKISLSNIVFFTIGVVFSEILLNFLMPALSNIIYLIQINDGSLYGNLIKSLNIEQANAIINTYNNFPVSYFSYFGLAFLYAFSSNYLFITLIARTNKLKQLIFIFLILVVLNAIYYFTNPLINNYSILILTIVSFTTLSFAELNFKLLFKE